MTWIRKIFIFYYGTERFNTLARDAVVCFKAIKCNHGKILQVDFRGPNETDGNVNRCFLVLNHVLFVEVKEPQPQVHFDDDLLTEHDD